MVFAVWYGAPRTPARFPWIDPSRSNPGTPMCCCQRRPLLPCSMFTTDVIAVTGVTGGLGGRVARRLAERGVRQRLVVRDPGRAPELAGAEVAAGSYDDPEQLRRAFEGAAALFMVSASEDPDRLRLHANVGDAARGAGGARGGDNSV